MKIKNLALARTAFSKKDLIDDPLPKIAFIGRSNVGKSSLINRLMERKNLARTSSKPGKTVSINYYQINELFYFVDLPGYGYSKIPKSEITRVVKLISGFFQSAINVKLVLLLVDSRRGFMPPDLEILAELVEKNYRILTILTKSDKINRSTLQLLKQSLKKQYNLRALSFSIKSIQKRLEIWNCIDEALKE